MGGGDIAAVMTIGTTMENIGWAVINNLHILFAVEIPYTPFYSQTASVRSLLSSFWALAWAVRGRWPAQMQSCVPGHPHPRTENSLLHHHTAGLWAAAEQGLPPLW